MYDFKPPYFGAAYYPEAWPREEIDADLDRLQSHGMNTVRIAEFAWSTMEPQEGVYDMSLFREVVDKCKERGIAVIMCTPSATPPSWMAHKYPEIFAMDAAGNRVGHGSRRMTCPTSKLYRRFCAKIVEVMAKEFANDENIIGWQIDNEINIMPAGTGCTCPECAEDFHNYLREKYGTIDKLNDDWGHFTWSLNFSDFDEVDTYKPSGLPAVHKYTWEKYKSLSHSDFCAAQADVIRKYTDKPIGTDMMPTHQLDPAETNSHLDVAQFNYYGDVARFPFWLDAYRRLFDRHIWVTETSCCWNAGNTPNGFRKKGFCTANTLMTFASGSEMCLYWLFRSHRGGYEMGHGSVVDAWGRDMASSPEVKALGKTIKNLAPMVRGTMPKKSEIAISFHHFPYVIDKYASFETMPHRYDYEGDIRDRIYLPIIREKYRPDILFDASADISDYKLIISHRQLTLEEGDFLEKIMPWVENGGTWVVGPYTDMLTGDLAKYKNAPFGHLENWTKVRREFYVSAPNPNMPGASNVPLPSLTMEDGSEAKTVSNLCFDALSPSEDVKVLARYASGMDYIEGYAAITETKIGKGRIILMGTQLDPSDYRKFIKKIAIECGIEPICEANDTVEVNLLEGEYGTVLAAIECGGSGGSIIMPFDCTDIDTGESFTKGQNVAMAGYKCIFAKKN
jgi:beta-galactosidase GanA